jgi:hypothetical protein
MDTFEVTATPKTKTRPHKWGAWRSYDQARFFADGLIRSGWLQVTVSPEAHNA